MALYLVQHGLSLSKDEDPQRGLSEKGKEDVVRIGEVAKMYGIKVSAIKHSGKQRALQTADLLADFLRPPGGVVKLSGLNPLDDTDAFAKGVSSQADIMYVGHLPFMEILTSQLVAGNAALTVFRFQNGGIVCLDQDENTDSWYIKWTLMPNIG